MSEANLTLWQIEADLAELMLAYDEAEDDSGRAACEEAIAQYVAREVAKVDGIAAYLRMCDARAKEADEEAERITNIAMRWDKRAESLRRATLAAMEAAGKQRIDGKLASLIVRKNPAHVEYDEALLPAEYVVSSVKMNRALCAALAEFMQRFTAVIELFDPRLVQWWATAMLNVKNEPAKRAIAAALKESCGLCLGDGAIITFEQGKEVRLPCSECGGTGKQGVPGARLVQDTRLEVK